MTMLSIRHVGVWAFENSELQILLHPPGTQRHELIDDFGLWTADYLRVQAFFIDATTMERISFASVFRSIKRFLSVAPASAISSIQQMDSSHSSSTMVIFAMKSAGDIA
jgi:hypothetical protein